MRKAKRPDLRLELASLGTVNPFKLKGVEIPPGSGEFFLEDPDRRRVPLERTSLRVVGAGQALISLSLRWMLRAGRDVASSDQVPPPLGEVRLLVRRKEGRLLAALLGRHLKRLPQPPDWMPELHRTLEEIDAYLKWEE